MDVEAIGREVADLLSKVAHYVQPFFPHHAEAIFGEIVDTKLTGERWNRVGKIIASICSVPGTYLVGIEHDRRNMLISCRAVVDSMSIATSGIGNCEHVLGFVQFRTRELQEAIK